MLGWRPVRLWRRIGRSAKGRQAATDFPPKADQPAAGKSVGFSIGFILAWVAESADATDLKVVAPHHPKVSPSVITP